MTKTSTTRRTFLLSVIGAIGSLFLPIWSFAKHYWPVRTVEKSIPQFDPASWRLAVDGLVEKNLVLSYPELLSLPAIEQTSNLDCVEMWSVRKLKWKGVRLTTIIEKVKPKPEAKFLTVYCSGGTYTESLSLAQALAPDVMLAYIVDDKPLSPEHGAPLRLVVPEFWAYKSAKWVERIEFTDSRHVGYWEQRGYQPDSGPKREANFHKIK